MTAPYRWGVSTPPPLCECHGEPMRWNASKAYRDGGAWRCKARDRAAARDRFAAKYADPIWRAKYLASRNERRRARRAQLRSEATA